MIMHETDRANHQEQGDEAMTTVSLPRTAARMLMPTNRAITDGSDQPVMVTVRPAGLFFAGQSITLPVDRSRASEFEIQSRAFTLRRVIVWITAALFASQATVFALILFSKQLTESPGSNSIILLWFSLNTLGLIATTTTLARNLRRISTQLPLAYPTLQSGRIVISNANPSTAAEWQRLNHKLDVELYDD